MTTGAFGEHPDPRFSSDDFLAIVPAIYNLDRDTIVQFMRDHVTSRTATRQLIYTLADCSAGIVHTMFGDDRAAVLNVGDGATRAQRLMGQIITTSINGDHGTTSALVTTLLDHTEASDDPSDVATILVEMFQLVSFLMHQAAGSRA